MSDRAIKEIILIDDEPGVLLALKMLLTALGYSVIAYADPEEALQAIATNTTSHLILSDLRMPKLDGICLLKGIMTTRPDIPFILMSGHAVTDEVQTALSLGAKGFLAKPFTPDQLKDLISKIH